MDITENIAQGEGIGILVVVDLLAENVGDEWAGGSERFGAKGMGGKNDHDWACDGQNAVGDCGDSELGVHEAGSEKGPGAWSGKEVSIDEVYIDSI